MVSQGRTGSPNFGGIFFRGGPQKNAAKTKMLTKKKKSLNKNYKGAIAAAQKNRKLR
jgi:hypothetical protein